MPFHRRAASFGSVVDTIRSGGATAGTRLPPLPCPLLGAAAGTPAAPGVAAPAGVLCCAGGDVLGAAVEDEEAAAAAAGAGAGEAAKASVDFGRARGGPGREAEVRTEAEGGAAAAPVGVLPALGPQPQSSLALASSAAAAAAKVGLPSTLMSLPDDEASCEAEGQRSRAERRWARGADGWSVLLGVGWGVEVQSMV